MKLKQNPMNDYRQNLILYAIVQFDKLLTFCHCSPDVAETIKPLCEASRFVGVINNFAYSHIPRIVPPVLVECWQEELVESPITSEEIILVLQRPIGEAWISEVCLGQQA